MNTWNVGFERPWWLLALLLIPLIWTLSFRSLAGLGRYRRLFALTFRTLVMLLIIFALAEIQLLRTSEKMTVIYVLDQSASIPAAKREAMIHYVATEVREHRNKKREDRAGVIVFGRDAKIEIPPFDDDIHSLGNLDSYMTLQNDASNLASALKLAQASFPEDTAKRVVVVTDGNENVGDARSVAVHLADGSIAIDVVPIRLDTRAEIAVDKLVLPSDIRKGQPVAALTVISNHSEQSVMGKLKVTRAIGPSAQLLKQQDIELKPGKNVFSIPHEIEDTAFYTYRAEFSPADPADDLMNQNNQATAFTHVRGKGRVLLIENWETPGLFDAVVTALRENDIEVVVQPSNQLFSSLAELQGYDSVLLANVPRSSGEDSNSVASFSDEQIRMLVHSTETFGSGMIMLGGEHSFGAGGWTNTELEKAMPVDFQIYNAKVQAVGALAMCMHASELPDGNYWQKVIAQEALKALGPNDYCGITHFGMGSDEWLWGGRQGLLQVGGQRQMMLAKLNRMTPGDMPDFDSSMKLALIGFKRVNASIKHMIIISDGDPSPPSKSLLSQFVKEKIQISTVAVGTHGPAGSTPLKNIAVTTGGKYYVVTNPKALPKIYQREARKITRTLLFEQEGLQPEIVYHHEMLQGITGPVPPIGGFVLTRVKENPLVEVSILAPKPDGGPTSTILAGWTYGAGRTAVFTTDCGAKWAKTWPNWPDFGKFFTQMVRWSMRPVNEEGKFSISTDVKDGKVRVVITALDKDDSFLNFLNFSGSAVSPQLESFDFKVQQVAPGRYVGEFDSGQAGSYFVTLNPGPGHGPILSGVDVPYSAEYRDRTSNWALINALAGVQPKGGQPGKIIDTDMTKDEVKRVNSVDTFRHNLPKAISRQNVWPLVVLIASCLFFGDVFVRRVAIGFEWLLPIWMRVRRVLFRTQEVATPDQRLERLRSRKAAVAGQIDERRAATRFAPEGEPTTRADKDLESVIQAASGQSGGLPGPTPASSAVPLQADHEESYTERLLKAKQRARRDNSPNS